MCSSVYYSEWILLYSLISCARGCNWSVISLVDMSEVGRDSAGGVSRAAKKRRKDTRKKQMSASSHAAVDTKQRLGKPKKSSLKTKETSETSFEHIDLTFALNFEEFELTIMKRKNYLLNFLLGNSTSISDFYEDFFEKRPLEIHIKDALKLKDLFSFASFQHILRHHLLTNQRDIFLSKVSSSHIEQSPSHSSHDHVYNYTSIMESCKRSFGVCLLQPHTLDDSLWKFLSILEIEFNSRVSSKVYYLPSHAEDALSKLTNPQFLSSNVFYILLQGNCSFRLYNPDKIDAQSDLYLDENGEIKPKDLLSSEADAIVSLASETSQVLYVPKGWIVDFGSASSSFSVEGTLILTICFNESGSVADLVDSILPQALASQIASNSILKASLPSSFISLYGVSKTSEDDEDEDEVSAEEVMKEEEDTLVLRKDEKERLAANKADRKLFSRKMKSVFESLVAESMGLLDAAADQVVTTCVAILFFIAVNYLFLIDGQIIPDRQTSSAHDSTRGEAHFCGISG